jgi:hypothetical protein
MEPGVARPCGSAQKSVLRRSLLPNRLPRSRGEPTKRNIKDKEMRLDKKLMRLVDELNSHFKA